MEVVVKSEGFDLPRRRREEEPWAFIFVCRKSSIEWSGNQLSGDLEASAASTYELQRKLVQTVLAFDSSGGVQPSFSPITPSSAVFQVFLKYEYLFIKKTIPNTSPYDLDPDGAHRESFETSILFLTTGVTSHNP
ncbi:hypothetical protein J5N97_009153 [Dioscorea zingiberensis]|uniref:Uncharacterized protein n=1 Tax=Dioscorea zingiberensis TaxID=325984 RepID=A0A9D5HLI7_9LILI|nr:hypothetical protein J5N97_009153 [Dioscorea zingiberensis]